MDNNLMNSSLKAQLAAMESKVDLLESELSYMDDILRKCGFPSGITTLKQTVEELLSERMREEEEE